MTTVSIIIPTTCEARRAQALGRAIDSVLLQQHVKVELIVVVNGDRFDPHLRNIIAARPGAAVYYNEEANVSAARYFGREHATGEYFGFLDDDDELLPDALLTRVSHMEHDGSVDVLVTNGYTRVEEDVPRVTPGLKINGRLVESFMDVNWFASPASLFRTATVEASLFKIEHKYFEWTYLFFLLISNGKTIKYTDLMTYRVNEDHPVSASKSEEYQLAYPAFLEELSTFKLSDPTRKAIRKKYVNALNSTSQLYLSRQDLRTAVAYHVKCLLNGGWRYAPYTRKLVSALWSRR